jgi:hypothetical protein
MYTIQKRQEGKIDFFQIIAFQKQTTISTMSLLSVLQKLGSPVISLIPRFSERVGLFPSCAGKLRLLSLMVLSFIPPSGEKSSPIRLISVSIASVSEQSWPCHSPIFRFR